MEKKVRYRLEVNYLSRDYENSVLETSIPIYNLKDGWKEYRKAVKEYCVDNKTVPARVWLWKYNYMEGKFSPITIAKNY